MDKIRLGRRLMRRRKEAGLTQLELASRIGTTQGVISRIETGKELPSLPMLGRIADATGGPLEITVGGSTRSLSPSEKRRRVESVLGEQPFDPWERDPSAAEIESLVADGLSRERFQS